jgi:predicted nucleotidyltransferase
VSYYNEFLKITDVIKEEDKVAAILLIGKTSRVKHQDFDSLNDVDLLVVYESNRTFERQVENIEGVPFDISYISIFDLITQVEGRSEIWVNIIMGAQVYYSENELIFGIIDRVKDIYLNGTSKLSLEDIEFIRFNLSQKLTDIENRMKDVVLSSYLMQRLFSKTIEDYYALNAMWLPNPKNMFENLEIVNSEIANLAKQFVYECTAKQQLNILREIVNIVLEPFGGRLTTWKKGHYHIAQ